MRRTKKNERQQKRREAAKKRNSPGLLRIATCFENEGTLIHVFDCDNPKNEACVKLRAIVLGVNGDDVRILHGVIGRANGDSMHVLQGTPDEILWAVDVMEKTKDIPYPIRVGMATATRDVVHTALADCN